MNLRLERRSAAVLFFRALLFALLWWIVTEGAVDSWVIGAPAVLIAAYASVALLPPTGIFWTEVIRFIPFFLARSLYGGVDVARRALHPQLPIAPALVEYPLRLSIGLPRVILANTIALLPGTLSVDITADRLLVHVLDERMDYMAEFNAVEHRVARLFAQSLPIGKGEERDETI